MEAKNMLKRGVWILSIIEMLILNLLVVQAISYEVSYKCEEDFCVAGENVDWTIHLFNRGQKMMEITSIELEDDTNNSVFASYSITYDFYKSVNEGLLILEPNNNITKLISARLPGPNNDNKLGYRFCYSATTRENRIAIKNEIYTVRTCDSKNYSLVVLDCRTDLNCGYDEFCQNYNCMENKCDECQYISEHKCVDYDCCDSNSCGKGDYCDNNMCAQLNCTQAESFFNHTCVQLNCSQDTFLFNHSCSPLNCSQDELFFDHTCQKLNCSQDTFLFNHSCIKLDCSQDESFDNHTCQKLDCMFNQTVVDHTCQKLDCAFFHKMVNHQCINDKPLIFRLSIELIIVSIIIFLLIIDVRKYESKKNHIKTKERKLLSKNDKKYK